MGLTLQSLGFVGNQDKGHSYLPGVLIHEDPVQVNLEDGAEWDLGYYKVRELAQYEISGRVLGRQNYWFGKESEISPMDLALGWQGMSDQSNLDQIKFGYASRFFSWRTNSPEMSPEFINTHSSNIHIVPANPEVKEALNHVQLGDLVRLQGALVEVRGGDGWYWKSSLSRNDSGNGACELMWVTGVEHLDQRI